MTREVLAAQVWSIETYHRGLKQFCGAERAQVRAARAQRNHIGFAIRAFVRLEHHRIRTGTRWLETKMGIIRAALPRYLTETSPILVGRVQNPATAYLLKLTLSLSLSTTSACVPQPHPRRLNASPARGSNNAALHCACIDDGLNNELRDSNPMYVSSTPATSAVAASCSLRAFARLPAHAPVEYPTPYICHPERSEGSQILRSGTLRV
jgi:hypothetical protein